jgi:hypothetical protein
VEKHCKAWKAARLTILFLLALSAVTISLSAAHAAQVAITVEKLTADGGFIAEPELVSLPYGASAGQVTVNFLESKSINIQYAGKPTESYFYIKNISGYGDDGTKGWMITVGNTFIKTSAGVHTLKNKDVIRWQYTSNYGRDIGAGDIWDWDETSTPIPSEKPDKDALIWKVAEINAAGKQSSYSAYNAAVSVLKKLDASQSEIKTALDSLNDTNNGGDSNNNNGGDSNNNNNNNGDSNNTGGGGGCAAGEFGLAAVVAAAVLSAVSRKRRD